MEGPGKWSAPGPALALGRPDYYSIMLTVIVTSVSHTTNAVVFISRKMSAETRASDIFDLNSLIISPPLLKTCSIGELDAGTLRARRAG